MHRKFATLLIDDDPIFSKQVENALCQNHRMTVARTLEAARSAIKRNNFEIVLVDKYLEGGQIGTSFVPEIKALLPHAVIIIITSEVLDDSVVEALRAGATDYLQKGPGVIPALLARITVAVNRLAMEKRLQKAESLAADRIHFEMVGQSNAMRHLRETIRTIEGNDINVLITGETGTGKELVARALNQSHGDLTRPFICLNCGAIPKDLVESELFGHEKGSFTGASSEKKGKIELVDGGDLFLDEVGELALDIQVKLLRVLQDGSFSRIGGNESRRSNFRVIAATNRNLERMIEEKTFRQDLYYRIAVYEITTTPLRDRKEDIQDLAEHFVKTSKLGGAHYTVASEVLEYLQSLRWNGNIRELSNCVETALVFAKRRNSKVILLKDVQSRSKRTKEVTVSLSGLSRKNPEFRYSALEYEEYLKGLDRAYLAGALEAYGWDLELAASKLGISRSKIYKRARDYKLKHHSGRDLHD